ncbi:MAG: PIN domain-containing protein [Acidobacteriota bacterium]
MKIALDTNVVVEYLTMDSAKHGVTRACCDRYEAAGAEFVLAEHCILEAFSVLSRMPRSVALPPRDIETLLLRGFGHATVAPIRRGLAWETVRHTLDRGFSGGRVYDAVIALSAFEAGAEVLLTWNMKHFLTIAPVGLEIREPR